MINFEKKFLKNYLRHCILLSYVDEITAPMVCDLINEVYGANTITRCTIYKWYRRFKKRDLSLIEDKTCGKISRIIQNKA